MPNFYFRYCCEQTGKVNQFFGLYFADAEITIGTVYDVQLPSVTGCAVSIDVNEITNSEYPIYSDSFFLTEYSSCNACTANTVSCIQTPRPTPTTYYTINTRCGEDFVYRNSCEPIVIFPLGVKCNSTNPTDTLTSDGSISLTITGGTPPYTISWSNSMSGPIIQNLPVGDYTSTVTDSYGDFTVVTTCSLTGVTRTPQPTPTPTPTPDNNSCLNMVTNGSFDNSLSPWVSSWDQGWRWSSYNGGSAEYIGTDDHSTLSQTNVLIVGCTYQIDYDVYNNTDDGSGYVIPILGTNTVTGSAMPPGFSHQTFTLVATDNGNFSLEGYFGNKGSVTIDNVVVCQVECQDELLPQERYCFHFYIVKGGRVSNDSYIDFYLNGTLNGYPQYSSMDGEYNMNWSSTLNKWEITSTQNTFQSTILNSSTSAPPLGSWVIYGVDYNSYVTGVQGGCSESNLCATISSDCGIDVIELTTGGTMAGEVYYVGNYPCGQSGQWIIYYNPTNSRWETSGLTNVSGILSEANSNTSVINESWSDANNYSLDTTGGECGGTSQYSYKASTNESTGRNDGTITFEDVSGKGPFTYSIDGGNSFSPFPIFTNLKPGDYVTAVKDGNGNIKKETITLRGKVITTYSVKLNTNTKILTSTKTKETRLIKTTISITPELPSGTYLNFDLVHFNNSSTSPNNTVATITSTTSLNKNSISYSANSISVSTATTTNNISGCQRELIYYTAKTESWSNITYSSTTSLELVTTTDIQQNNLQKCYLATSIDTYSLNNISILGCSNCDIINLT